MSTRVYNDLFREVDTRHQLVMHLGFKPQDGLNAGAYPLALGLPLNRGGQDFTDRDIVVLHLLRRIARPVLRRKRLDHHLRLLDRATLSPELKRSRMGLGLTERQADVAFWIRKGAGPGHLHEKVEWPRCPHSGSSAPSRPEVSSGDRRPEPA